MSPLWNGTASTDVFDVFDVSTDLLGWTEDYCLSLQKGVTNGCREQQATFVLGFS